MAIDEVDVALVVLTYNRRQQVLHTLGTLLENCHDVPIWVVDNGSRDGTARAIAEHYPGIRVVALPRNLGAAARNYGAQAACARYIAFCDDDTWWAPGALARGVAILEAQPGLAVLTARILVGPEEHLDPTSAVMADSPIPNTMHFVGSEVAGIMAGASIMRRDAFLAAGGYEPRFFIGGEERLLALDLMAAGWHLGYAPELVVHHFPSRLRDVTGRRRLLVRNALWCAWLRRSARDAWWETRHILHGVLHDAMLLSGLAAALPGLPWLLANRRPVPLSVEERLRLLEGRTA